MAYQVRVGSVTGIVANEKQALDMIRRLAGTGNQEVCVKDIILGCKVEVEALESRMSGPVEQSQYERNTDRDGAGG